MRIALMLFWRKLSSSNAYPCPSMNYIDHRHCGKALSDPTILDSVELLPFNFCFHNSFIIGTDHMDIVTPVCRLQSGCAAKDAPTHHLNTIRLSIPSMNGRYRLTLMYLSTLIRFPHSSSSGILTQVHSKAMDIFMSFLALDVKINSCDTVWWNYVTFSLFSFFRLT